MIFTIFYKHPIALSSAENAKWPAKFYYYVFHGKHGNNKTMTDFTRATELTPEVESAIDDAFEYHGWSDEQQKSGKRVRAALADAVKVIIWSVPAGPDRTVAIRKIREARMDCNSAITHGGKY